MPRLKKLIIPAISIASLAAGALVMGACLNLSAAHAARLAAALADPVPTSPGIDWTFWLAVAGVALGALSAVLHIVAPRTKVTWDDKLRDDVDWLLSVLPKQPTLTVAPPPRNTQAGVTILGCMISLAIAGAIAGGAVLASSCATGRQTAAVGVVAALDCEAQHLTGDALGDLRGLAERTVQGWISGAPSADLATLRAKVRADLALFRTDAGRCAIAGALAALSTVVSRPGEAVSALAADPTMARAAFALEARAAAWPALQVAGTSI